MQNNKKRPGFRLLDPTMPREEAFLLFMVLAGLCLIVFGTAIVVNLP
jgi:hypothetical protein